MIATGRYAPRSEPDRILNRLLLSTAAMIWLFVIPWELALITLH
jgi:hypothetical protein